jgi:carboxypeptidase Taq
MLNNTFRRLCRHLRETARLQSIQALLEWDQQTYMPAEASDYRAEQLACLTSMIHSRQTDPQLKDWLDELSESPQTDPHSDMGATVRVVRREFLKESKKPARLVEELTRCTSLAQQIWIEARKDNDFGKFAPMLEQVIKLRCEEADAVGYVEDRYDAMIDDYEHDARASQIGPILDNLRDELVPLVQTATGSGKSAPNGILHGSFPIPQQEAFCRSVASAIGFDFERGRLDVTHHPFCSEVGPHDCRITTRYDEHFLPSALYSVLHEAGHGMYEQGLRSDWYGLPPGKSGSLGVHESQSRLWENQVGRSRPFWQHFLPRLQRHFAISPHEFSLDDWVWAVNEVRPSLIRVEADETTYNLHIIVRFELEQELVSGRLTVADLPAAWNERYEKYLGLRPSKDSEGVLQDIHWSAGLIGYFPTYTLGNLYAAQLFEAAEKDLGGLDGQFAAGEFAPLLKWLRTNIHRHGQLYPSSDLISHVTGQVPGHQALIRHLQSKVDLFYRA